LVYFSRFGTFYQKNLAALYETISQETLDSAKNPVSSDLLQFGLNELILSSLNPFCALNRLIPFEDVGRLGESRKNEVLVVTDENADLCFDIYEKKA
jgi:hypothetical protein